MTYCSRFIAPVFAFLTAASGGAMAQAIDSPESTSISPGICAVVLHGRGTEHISHYFWKQVEAQNGSREGKYSSVSARIRAEQEVFAILAGKHGLEQRVYLAKDCRSLYQREHK